VKNRDEGGQGKKKNGGESCRKSGEASQGKNPSSSTAVISQEGGKSAKREHTE